MGRERWGERPEMVGVGGPAGKGVEWVLAWVGRGGEVRWCGREGGVEEVAKGEEGRDGGMEMGGVGARSGVRGSVGGLRWGRDEGRGEGVSEWEGRARGDGGRDGCWEVVRWEQGAGGRRVGRGARGEGWESS